MSCSLKNIYLRRETFLYPSRHINKICYTRVSMNTVTVIHNVVTAFGRNIIHSSVREISLNDHYMVYCIRKFNITVLKGNKVIKTYQMKNFTEEAFLADVSDTDLHCH